MAFTLPSLPGLMSHRHKGIDEWPTVQVMRVTTTQASPGWKYSPAGGEGHDGGNAPERGANASFAAAANSSLLSFTGSVAGMACAKPGAIRSHHTSQDSHNVLTFSTETFPGVIFAGPSVPKPFPNAMCTRWIAHACAGVYIPAASSSQGI